jgi:hypothetical protein
MQPDPILPAQLYADAGVLDDPERHLRVAVLENAIRDFQRELDATGRRRRKLHEDAVDWFASRDRAQPFSFENVCDALHLDPDWIRQGLCRWRAAERARMAAQPAARGATMVPSERHLRAA